MSRKKRNYRNDVILNEMVNIHDNGEEVELMDTLVSDERVEDRIMKDVKNKIENAIKKLRKPHILREIREVL